MKSLIVVLVLLVAAGARAQTLPPTGQLYFVGTTEELELIRAAMRETECLRWGPEVQSCTYPGPQCTTIPNPYCGTNTYQGGGQANIIEAPFGLGEVDCMRSYHDFFMVEPLLGTTLSVNGVDVYIPTEGALVDDSDLPAECYDYLLELYCPAVMSEWWCYFGCAPVC